MERLIKVGHLRRYVQETVRGAETAPVGERIEASAQIPLEPWPTINYILGDLVNNKYKSKRKKKRLLRVATTRARVNTIHILHSIKAIQPIYDPISFPLVDPGSAADLLQLAAFKLMSISFDKLSLAGRIMSGFNGVITITMGDIALPVKAGPVVQ